VAFVGRTIEVNKLTMDGDNFSWCSYEHFEQALGGAGFADIFSAVEAAFAIDSDLTAATLGPPAKVEDSDGLGPLHLWFADGRSRAVFASLPSAPEPRT
jgi:hypothetical protein